MKHIVFLTMAVLLLVRLTVLRADGTMQPSATPPGVADRSGTSGLAGQWRFRADEQKVGVTEKWFAGDLTGQQRIRLPGTMNDAGLGLKNTAPPTLRGPYYPHCWEGVAWYQRNVEVPAAWRGRRLTLLLERCRWFTTVWLDDKCIGTRDSLIAPHMYDFGTGVAPGKHRLTIRVDNTVKLDLGLFVSALFGGTWGNLNGIIGRIELGSTSPVWIDDVQVYPNAKQKTARVVVKIGNATGRPGRGSLQIEGPHPVVADVTWDENGGGAEIKVDLSGAKFGMNLRHT